MDELSEQDALAALAVAEDWLALDEDEPGATEDLRAELLADAEMLAEDEQEEPSDRDHNPRSTLDAHMAQTVANRVLRGRFCWAGGLGWLRYRHGCWQETTEASVSERVRLDLIAQFAREARQGAGEDRRKALARMLTTARIRAIVSLTRGIVEIDPANFDRHPDLLNVGNGVVDLQTGELGNHDPALLLTKKTTVDYVPGVTSPDWHAALEALPPAVADWLQVRVGQAATGHPTPDDVMPVLQGGGSNGKTTVIGAIDRALGEHAVAVPERVLLANPSDHPTELTTLRGARLAILEETPEARHLNVKRLKDTCGTPTLTARKIGKDNVTWEATHSLLLTTNYVPRVDETDHGTWRRLALVQFPYTYTVDGEAVAATGNTKLGMAGLRERLRDGRQGQHEAVLAWTIAGARRWYDAERVMPTPPAEVKAATAAWRGEADLICGYLTDRLVFDPEAHVMATDLYADFCEWAEARGHKRWADQTLTARFAGHGMVEAAKVAKRKVYQGPGLSRTGQSFDSPPSRYAAWVGVRFRTNADDDAEERQAADLPKQSNGPGGPGYSRDSIIPPSRDNSRPPRTPRTTDPEASPPADDPDPDPERRRPSYFPAARHGEDQVVGQHGGDHLDQHGGDHGDQPPAGARACSGCHEVPTDKAGLGSDGFCVACDLRRSGVR